MITEYARTSSNSGVSRLEAQVQAKIEEHIDRAEQWRKAGAQDQKLNVHVMSDIENDKNEQAAYSEAIKRKKPRIDIYA